MEGPRRADDETGEAAGGGVLSKDAEDAVAELWALRREMEWRGGRGAEQRG